MASKPKLIKEHDVVYTKVSFPEIPKGSQCTVVHVYPSEIDFLIEYKNKVEHANINQLEA
jgi:uncharacterized membrane protein